MLRAAQRIDVPLWNTNPGASLPRLISLDEIELELFLRKEICLWIP